MARVSPSISNSCSADERHFAAAPPDIEAVSDFESVRDFEAGAFHNESTGSDCYMKEDSHLDVEFVVAFVVVPRFSVSSLYAFASYFVSCFEGGFVERSSNCLRDSMFLARGLPPPAYRRNDTVGDPLHDMFRLALRKQYSSVSNAVVDSVAHHQFSAASRRDHPTHARLTACGGGSTTPLTRFAEQRMESEQPIGHLHRP